MCIVNSIPHTGPIKLFDNIEYLLSEFTGPLRCFLQKIHNGLWARDVSQMNLAKKIESIIVDEVHFQS